MWCFSRLVVYATTIFWYREEYLIVNVRLQHNSVGIHTVARVQNTEDVLGGLCCVVFPYVINTSGLLLGHFFLLAEK